jgi:hypothetical protein
MSLKRAYRLAVLAAVAAAAWPHDGFAITQQGTQMMRNWAQADRCSARARKQFPDNTADSLAKRDQVLQQCLSDSVLAPRTPQAPGQQ